MTSLTKRMANIRANHLKSDTSSHPVGRAALKTFARYMAEQHAKGSVFCFEAVQFCKAKNLPAYGTTTERHMDSSTSPTPTLLRRAAYAKGFAPQDQVR